jgi:hypothetical protein
MDQAIATLKAGSERLEKELQAVPAPIAALQASGEKGPLKDISLDTTKDCVRLKRDGQSGGRTKSLNSDRGEQPWTD